MVQLIVEKIREIQNGVLAEVLNKIEKIESSANSIKHTDLKIHTISYYIFSNAENYGMSNEQAVDMFQTICEDEYMEFKDWERENLSYVERSYISRTSSFYYSSDWYGSVLDNSTIEELLEGKCNLKYVLGEIENEVYELLIENKQLAALENEKDRENLIEQLEVESEWLSNLLDDLETVGQIVDEALLAYSYLRDYKEESNEIELAKKYFNDLYEFYYAGTIARNLFEKSLLSIEKFNEVETFETDILTVNGKYVVLVRINRENNENSYSFQLDTNIKSELEFSEKFIVCVMYEIGELIENKF